jgi:formiminotetrahydrofolate cyclodeaminase
MISKYSLLSHRPEVSLEEAQIRTMSQNLITMPTDQLLTKFGAGMHKPGSGSAAALLGLVSCKLVQTVISLSHGRAEYQGVGRQLTLANQVILGDVEPSLMAAVQEDSDQFDRVVQARVLRDNETDQSKKKQLSEKALSELRIATEIPIRIAETCLTLCENAILVFDLGFKSARGDSGVAISAALAGASGCISIIFLNLGSFRGGEWAIETRKKADELSRRVEGLQIQLVERIHRLQQEAVKREGGKSED